jgi:hypothetical protein
MNLSVSAFPDSPENMGESADSDLRKNPVNEEHDREVSHDEIVSQKDVQVPAIWHKFSFLRGDNQWKALHELNLISLSVALWSISSSYFYI